jgi:hypothetical protein
VSPKKKFTKSSTRTMKECRRLGLRPGNVERFVRQAGPHGRAFDLWGWVDVMALGGGEVIAIQSCAMARRNDHLEKIREDPAILESLVEWLKVPGARAELWAWRKLKVKRGGTAVRWAVDRLDLREEFGK